jgi:hypothetical protein
MMRFSGLSRLWLLWFSAAWLAACSGDKAAPGAQPGGAITGGASGSAGTPGGAGAPGMAGSAGGDPNPTPGPFEALPAHVYAAKVKQLLTGLPLSAAELTAVTAGGRPALATLVDAWTKLPEYKTRLLVFLRQAFQQTQTDIADYDEQLGRPTNPWNNIDKVRFVRAAEESFARTALALIDEGKPFTETVTTTRFMLNPPLMSALAYMDAAPLGDDGKPVLAAWWLLKKYPGLIFERTTNIDVATGLPQPIPFADSINPQSPNWMRFYEPRPYAGANVKCKEPEQSKGAGALRALGDYLYGGRPGCGSTDSQWTAEDWDSWRWVTVRAPHGAEERSVFWDVPHLRDAATAELVLATPRVGFMTTPAFFANWPTNLSNSYRVTTNQALIVGLGRSFDDRAVTVQVSETSSDDKHVQPNTVCYGCHQTLDPMRDFFRQTYSLSYFQRLDPMTGVIPAQGVFAVDGVGIKMGAGIAAFASAMAAHPRFALAWTQQLCQFANSTACREDDPELTRIAAAFAASNHDFRVLVRELFSSPLVTFAETSKTAAEVGVVMSIARRETWCAALEARLQIPDICSLRGLPAGTGPAGSDQLRKRVRNLAQSIPGSGYTRGDEHPLLPHDPNLFFHAATENFCLVLASSLVDAPIGQGRFVSSNRAASIANLTSLIIGLPAGDPRLGDMTALLNEHFTAAAATGVTAREAMQSTFLLACQAPPALSLGL